MPTGPIAPRVVSIVDISIIGGISSGGVVDLDDHDLVAQTTPILGLSVPFQVPHLRQSVGNLSIHIGVVGGSANGFVKKMCEWDRDSGGE